MEMSSCICRLIPLLFHKVGHFFWSTLYYYVCSISGNNNKFKSQKECDDTCVENEYTLLHKDKCEQPIEEGPCAGNFSRWGYNTETEACEEFNYGGCKGLFVQPRICSISRKENIHFIQLSKDSSRGSSYF